jgi:ribosomal protein S18 acetylase RimI-like enzyme
MGEVLGWAGAAPIRLWVSEFNTRAVRFYIRYGFVATGERELWRGRLRNLRMVRPAAA